MANFQFDDILYHYHRLLILCLLENNGVLHMAREFGVSFQSEDYINENLKSTVSRVAQMVASIPDKAQLRAPTSLLSQYPLISSAG